jgi:hypothetical protein
VAEELLGFSDASSTRAGSKTAKNSSGSSSNRKRTGGGGDKPRGLTVADFRAKVSKQGPDFEAGNAIAALVLECVCVLALRCGAAEASPSGACLGRQDKGLCFRVPR